MPKVGYLCELIVDLLTEISDILYVRKMLTLFDSSQGFIAYSAVKRLTVFPFHGGLQPRQ